MKKRRDEIIGLEMVMVMVKGMIGLARLFN